MHTSGPLTVKELQTAQLVWFRVAQRKAFYQEIPDLKNDKQVSRKSSLKTLNPFIDSEELFRVGSRFAVFITATKQISNSDYIQSQDHKDTLQI